MDSNFLGVKTGMAPLVSMVFSLELGDRAGSTDCDIVRVEKWINHQLAIIDQTSIVYSCNKTEFPLNVCNCYQTKKTVITRQNSELKHYLKQNIFLKICAHYIYSFTIIKNHKWTLLFWLNNALLKVSE